MPGAPAKSAQTGRETEAAFAERVLGEEAAAIAALTPLEPAFFEAVGLLERCARSGGSVLVTGLGKSGLIGAKIAATFSSLGLPAHAVHPTEAVHGDLGRFRPCDTVLALSFSGETDEVVNLAAILRQDNIPIIAITKSPERKLGDPARSAGQKRVVHESILPSSLERLATATLHLKLDSEAGAPDFAAPTASTTATLALGDALGLVVARRLGLTDEDFRKRHPGGALGGLLRPVTEALRYRAGENLPAAGAGETVAEALAHAAAIGRRPGAIVVVDPDSGVLTGIFTDGDLRRLILRDAGELQRPIGEVMTRSPRTLGHTALVRDAVRMVREFRQDEIPIVDEAGRPVGVLDVQDLVALRLVTE
ncbi:MAG: SIS domain-containing protein [Phycisphaerales bacterium JB039]